MIPKLYNWYTVSEAVAAFGVEGTPKSLCDGQFIVLPAAILCFATAGISDEESRVSCPSCFVWRPQRLNYEPAGKWPWLPEEVREVYDRSQKPIRKVRDHHIFLRTPADERFFYAGEAHLESYGNIPGRNRSGVSANFSLSERLPRDVWLKLGGYPGWLVESNHETH
jgi:hypothetical protein